MNLSVVLALRDILLCVEHLKALFRTSIVDAQELVLSGGHIDKVRLALGAFLIEKLVHRFICWGFSQVGADDLVQMFSADGVSHAWSWERSWHCACRNRPRLDRRLQSPQ